MDSATMLTDPQKCPQCGTPNDVVAEFCISCGHRLSGRSTGDLIGKRINDWRIERLLGQGGMGEVYLASKDPGRRRSRAHEDFKVVLKIPRVRQLDKPARQRLKDRMLEEARALHLLAHGHIVPFQDVFEYQQGVVLAMRYIEGTDLASLIARQEVMGGSFPWMEAKKYANDILGALHFAHTHPHRPFIHGDVKPSNIRIESSSGFAWLIDFGLSVALMNLDDTPVAKGTLPYCAPEVLAGNPVTPLSDMYSMAVTLYELLSGRLPYDSDTPRTSLQQLEYLSQHRVPPLLNLRPDLPVGVGQAVHRALHLRPEGRFGDCEEFRLALAMVPAVVRYGRDTQHKVPKPGELVDSYVLRRCAYQGPIWETWYASDPERGLPVWITFLTDRRSWAYLKPDSAQTNFGTSNGTRGLLEVCCQASPPYLVSPAKIGERLLAETIAENELVEEDILSIVLQLLRVLRSLHAESRALGVLTPGNIVYDANSGQVAVLLTGLERPTAWALRRSSQTQRNALARQLPCLPPEFVSEQSISTAGDLHSLASVLLSLLGIQDADRLAPERELRKLGVGKRFRQLVLRCLQPNSISLVDNTQSLIQGLLNTTGMEARTPGEVRFLREVTDAVRNENRAELFNTLDHGYLSYGIPEDRGLELLHGVLERTGNGDRKTFASSLRQPYLEVWQDCQLGGLVGDGHRIKLETLRKELGLPRLLARYDESRDADGYLRLGGTLCQNIRGGTFNMGCEDGAGDERPVHPVTLDAYYISRFPVTVGQYLQFCGDTDYPGPAFDAANHLTDPLRPVSGVSYLDAIAFCEWLESRTGFKVTLPTEAQWEYACRYDEDGQRPWGNSEPTKRHVNFGNHTGSPMTVGQFPLSRSLLGVDDLLGNVWEWCLDWYGRDYYWESQAVNPQGPPRGRKRVLRGGSYLSDANSIRGSRREKDFPDLPLPVYGFRVVVNVTLE